jgi:hypothetical protein
MPSASAAQITKADEMRAAGVLKDLGYQRGHRRREMEPA